MVENGFLGFVTIVKDIPGSMYLSSIEGERRHIKDLPKIKRENYTTNTDTIRNASSALTLLSGTIYFCLDTMQQNQGMKPIIALTTTLLGGLGLLIGKLREKAVPVPYEGKTNICLGSFDF